MPMTDVVEGTAVALYENSYDSFQGQDGSMVQGGTKRVLYVVRDFNEAPLELRFRDDVAALLGQVKPWAQVQATCTLSGSVSRPRYNVTALKVTEGASK